MSYNADGDRPGTGRSGAPGATPSSSTPLEPTGVETVTGRYRRPVGGWLWLALLLVPLLLALLGLLGGRGGDRGGDATPAPAPTQTAAAPALEVERAGGRLHVRGPVPDEATHKAVLSAVRAGSGRLGVADHMKVASGSQVPAPAGLSPVLGAASGVEDLVVRLEAQRVVLRGVAPDQVTSDVVAAAAKAGFPGLAVENRMTIKGAPVTPVAAAPLNCDQLQSDLAARLQSEPVYFAVSGAKVTPESEGRLLGLGQQITKCPYTALEVGGHTDSTGSASTNTTLSKERAASVRQVLVTAGVPAEKITAQGYGSSRPVASNDTDEGRAANRRVEITVK